MAKSKRQLMREIRRAINDVNERMMEYYDLVDDTDFEMNPTFVEEFESLYKNGLSGSEKTYYGVGLKPSFYTKINGKSKTIEDLQKQLNELNDFLAFDVYSPIAGDELDEIDEKRYQTYIANASLDESEFTRAAWQQMFGAYDILSKRIESFGYEDAEARQSYVNLYSRQNGEKRRTFGDTLEKALNILEKKNEGKKLTKDEKSIIKNLDNTTMNYQNIIRVAEELFKRT